MKLFERVRQISSTVAPSQTAIAKALGLSQSKFNGYLNAKSEKNLWDHLPKILAEYPQVSRDWLFFGEGEMLRADTARQDQTSERTTGSIAPFPVPIVGLAACGLEGIEQIMPYAVTASPIALGPRSVAVVASGESMAPAGIASGHMCFCDPDQVPLPGEAVFFRRKDDKGALKLFLGGGTRKGYTKFKGWLPARDDQGHQREFLLDVLDSELDYIAPVVFVRRRL